MFGWIRERFWNHIRSSPDKSDIAYLLPFDTRQYLSPMARQETVRLVEGLAQEFPILKEGFRGIARHVIGKGLEPQINTANLSWNEEAELQLEEYLCTPDRFDLAGLRSGYDGQNLGIEQRIFRGEFFVSATTNPRWVDPGTGLQEPCWQFWDTNEIRTPEDKEEGVKIFDGVQLGANNYREGYHVTADGGSAFIPASAMVHWFQPTAINQTRGESDFAPAINRLVHWADLEKLFTVHAKTHATIAVAVRKLAKVGGRGAFSGLRRSERSGTGTLSGNDKMDVSALEKAFPGRIAYLGADGDAQVINNTSPSETLAKFITDVLAPNVFASLGIPPEFFWQVTRAGGPSQRFILSRADLLFQVLADALVYRWLNQVAFRFIQHRIRIGRLAKPEDPNWSSKLSWQTPAKLSIDRGDAQLEIEQLRNGTINLRSVFDRRGLRWREETRQWIREWLVFDKLADEEKATDEQKARLRSRWRTPQGWSFRAEEGQSTDNAGDDTETKEAA